MYLITRIIPFESVSKRKLPELVRKNLRIPAGSKDEINSLRETIARTITDEYNRKRNELIIQGVIPDTPGPVLDVDLVFKELSSKFETEQHLVEEALMEP
jgi:hypothetical protein